MLEFKYLEPCYYNNKSFYNKAECVSVFALGKWFGVLLSYNKIVAILQDRQVIFLDYYSKTTTRHIKDYLYQLGIDEKIDYNTLTNSLVKHIYITLYDIISLERNIRR